MTRQSRRGRVARGLLVGLVAPTLACTTTHRLGRLGDTATLPALAAAAARPDALAHVETLPGVSPRSPGDPVRALSRDGIVVAATSGPTVLVPFARVRSVSTYDHARGARDGALVLGLAAFAVGAAAGLVLANHHNTDGCGDCQAEPPRDPALYFFGVGGALGLVGAVIGAGLGGLAGHEDRYVISPP